MRKAGTAEEPGWVKDYNTHKEHRFRKFSMYSDVEITTASDSTAPTMYVGNSFEKQWKDEAIKECISIIVNEGDDFGLSETQKAAIWHRLEKLRDEINKKLNGIPC